MKNLIQIISKCDLCKASLPQSPKPILQLGKSAKIIVIGQAPGRLAHETGKPWNDKSGERLRRWLNLTKNVFYDSEQVALIPMGFCFPGSGKSGDLPPKKECAPFWHPKILTTLPVHIPKLLVGSHAQQYYLNDKLSLTDRCRQWQHYTPDYLPLPHPSPRNNIWIKKNPWFEAEVLPEYQKLVGNALSV
ncbi:uracil-DNA glycosylase family protein [Planctobacterium marinum]|uniref:uracil-DNA glycosylase family protein n=1 Tax=Planctobacterium marinum TaxID=1631968 RepID=UPI0030C778F8